MRASLPQLALRTWDESPMASRKCSFHAPSRMLTPGPHHGSLMNEDDHVWAAGLSVSGVPPASAAQGVAAKRGLSVRLRLRDARKKRRIQVFSVLAFAGLIPS